MLRINFVKATTAAAVVLFSGMITTGCASKAHKIEAMPVAVSPTDNPSEQISQLEAAFAQAKEANVPMLAPTWYQQASDSFAEAKQLREKSSDMTKIFQKLSEARLELERANNISKTSEKVLADVIAARQSALASQQAARKAGAVNLEGLRENFLKADQQFVSLAEDVENDNIKSVEKDKHEVVASYLRSQRDATKKETLDVARRTIEEAKKQDAKKYAPESFEFAQETLKRAEKFVQENPTDRQGIEQQSTEATFYANRALKMTLDARNIAGKRPEQVALGANAMRLQGDKRAQTLIAEAEKNRGTAALDERVATIKGIFEPSEAEVLRDGSKIILRLKSVNFPSGKSEIGKDNVALMGKIKQAMEICKDDSITIQGHTDSVGSDGVNNRLSQERAEMVKSYLVSQGAVEKERVAAVGLGSSKPLTSNKTKAGRATNRRIDIVVDVSKEDANEVTDQGTGSAE